MPLSDLSPDKFVQELKNNPDHESLLKEFATRLKNDAFATRNALAKEFGESTDAKQKVWSNCLGEPKCTPKDIMKPKCLNDLLSAVKTAKVNNCTLRAVGSGHSFSDVATTDGFLLDPHGMDAVLALDTAVLKDPSSAKGLFSVESGITIKALNQELDKAGVALANMGAFDGQTLAGAISTGTHGTGITFGPIASSVRALVLVGSDGTVYQIEPSNGITDPHKFASSANPNKIQLKQDDDWFNTTLVAMGCTGLIYSYIIAVEPAYLLQEFRKSSTWEDLKGGLAKGADSPILHQHRGYEIDINPYLHESKKHACVEITHNNTALPAVGTRGLWNGLATVISMYHWTEALLVRALNLAPIITPWAINTAIDALPTPADEKNGYIDKSFKVLDVGGAVNNLKAYAMELSIPCDEHLVTNVDKLIGIMDSLAKEKDWYLAGPVNLRFVAESNAFLAPQANRITCMVEMDTLYEVKTSEQLLKEIKRQMCQPGNGIRVHWGLDLDTVTKEDVPKMYPDFPKWLATYKELNKDGMWNNEFTRRIGISIGSKK